MPLARLLMMPLGLLWAAGVVSSEKPAPPPDGRGDVQVGAAGPERSPRGGSKVPGIFPVYEAGGRWMVVERPKGKRLVGRGADLLVIGSKGVDRFQAARSTRTYLAACEGARPAPTTAFLLSAASPRSFSRVGAPVIAILLKKGAKVDPSQAAFRALPNQAREAVYRRLEEPLREAILSDLAAGAFRIAADDQEGQLLARNPNPEKLQMKIDFASRVGYRGLPEAFLLVEGAQVSRTYRRCLRLFSGEKPLGACAEMPHQLMAETRGLEFVAYDPGGRGRPFILAYTETEPLWGHERWGFQLTDGGPKLFLRDALDPRCREAF